MFESRGAFEASDGATSASWFEDRATGATWVHVRAPWLPKLFSITFRTTPRNDSGLPHLLEHLVFCGSERYPVRAPLLEMKKRSLATIVNGLTGRELTHYVVSSPVARDVLQLADVCLDAVFRPTFCEADFRREVCHLRRGGEGGYRLEGIVLNEMRAQYAAPDRRLVGRGFQALLPRYPFAFDPAGDPAAIPGATLEGTREFHRGSYRPGNACVVTFGDLPEGEMRECIRRAIGRGPRREPPSPVSPPPSAPESPTLRFSVPAVGPRDAAGVSSVLWSFGDRRDPEDELVHAVVSEFLVGREDAPLARRLAESGLGRSPASGGVGRIGAASVFRVGWRGVAAPELDFGKHDRVVETALREIVGSPIDPELVEESLDHVLRSRREITRRLPLRIMESVAVAWAFGRSPLRPLDPSGFADPVRRRLGKEPAWMARKIEELLLENERRVVALGEPGEEGDAFERNAHERALARFRGALPPDAREETGRRAEDPGAMPPNPREEIEKLPRLRIADLPAARDEPPVRIDEVGRGFRVVRVAGPTNGFVYLRIAADLTELPAGEWPRVRLLQEWLPHAGRRSDALRRHARTIEAGVDVVACNGAPPAERAFLVLDLKTVDRDFEALVDLLFETLLAPGDPDLERLGRMASRGADRVRAGFLRSPLARARAMAGAAAGPFGPLVDLAAGPRGADLLTTVADEPAAAGAEGVWELGERLFRREPVWMGLAGSEEAHAVLRRAADRLAARRRPREGDAPPPVDALSTKNGTRRIGIRAPTDVASCVLGRPGPGWSSPSLAAATVGCGIVELDHLFPSIREAGGAYAVGCRAVPWRRQIQLFSGRDPDPRRSLEAFRKSGEALAGRRWPAGEVERRRMAGAGELLAVPRPREEVEFALRAAASGASPGLRSSLYDGILRLGVPEIESFFEHGLRDDEPGTTICVVARGSVLENLARADPGEGWEIVGDR